jgi:hypothetical protein
MKRSCLVVAFFFFILSTEAQTLYPRIGITASVNTYQEANTDIEPRIGFTAGLGYNLPLSKLFSVQAELNYVQKSLEAGYDNTTMIQYGDDIYALHEKGTERYAFSYLELPVLVKVRILHDNIFALGGFSIGLGMGGSYKYTYESTSSYLDPVYEGGSGKIKFEDPPSTTDENVYFDNRWDAGFHAGLGVLIAKKIQVECRYTHGMVNLTKDIDSKNRCLQITLATPLHLKR